jgi:hypothetical protein
MTPAREELIARKTLQIMRTFPTDPALYGPHPRIPNAIMEASFWVVAQITAVRLAAEPNPWKEQPDEIICREILRVARLKEATLRNKILIDQCTLLQKGHTKP